MQINDLSSWAVSGNDGCDRLASSLLLVLASVTQRVSVNEELWSATSAHRRLEKL